MGQLLRRLHAEILSPVRLYVRWKLFGLWSALDALGRLPAEEIPDALRRFGATVGEGTRISHGLRIENAAGDLRNLAIGRDVLLECEVFFDLTGRISIGDGVTLASRVCVVTHISTGDRPLAGVYPTVVEGVTIANGASVGTGTVILHGVSIGERAVVAPQSLVNRSIPGESRAAGIPAREARPFVGDTGADRSGNERTQQLDPA